MIKPRPTLFKWRHFEPEIIVCAVRWYLRFSLSYRDVEELLVERGLPADHTSIWRWVQRYACQGRSESFPPGRSKREPLRGREALPRRRAKPAEGSCSFVDKAIEAVGKWETCFWFSTFPSAFVAGAVGMGESRLSFGEISKGLVGRVGSLPLAFHAFHRPAISTALFFFC